MEQKYRRMEDQKLGPKLTRHQVFSTCGKLKPKDKTFSKNG